MTRNELEEFSDFLHQTSQLDLSVKKGAGPDDGLFDEDEEISDHAWEDSGKFEGDLILNDRQRRLIVENVEGLSRNGE
ncbi:Metalloendopeptidase [Operophtera brumata]|uniref:Metalloendopeptidase n=1 Tax=Operophtera brumata TaxID=104452 RepID=A0A0L7LJW5_OPEBR|nr:Metalloendopeptidase [Operophtera brumata]